jgi:hypothetical protein
MLAMVRLETGFGPNMPPLPYVRAVAQRLGGEWGLNGKRGNPNDPSGDILAYRLPGQPQLYDVLQDGGGANGVAWQPLEYPQTAGAVWLDPGAPEPQPQPEPSDLAARVKVLEDRADVQGMQLQEQAAMILSLRSRVATLEATDPPPQSYHTMAVTLRYGADTFAGLLSKQGE